MVVCGLVAGRAQAQEQGQGQEQAAPPADPNAPPVYGSIPQSETPGAVPLAAAQAPPARTARNSVFIELGGSGVLYSINYDRVINEYFSVRAGLEYMSVSASVSAGGSTASAKATFLGIPVIGNFLWGNENHKLEVGAGLTIFRVTGSASSLDAVASGSGVAPVGTGVIGYRYAPHDGGFTFRAGFTPLFSKEGWQPWGGLSFGYLF